MAVAAPSSSFMSAIKTLPEDSALLINGVAWSDYERLLAELEAAGRNVRVTYDRGKLEIMTLTYEHERYKALFAHLLAILTEELGLPLIGGGSVTLKRANQAQGAEPDDSYHIQRAAAVRGKLRIDLETDPPPDLAVEVDITSSSLPRFPIYAEMGVPELWRFDGQQVQFYRLVNVAYQEIMESGLFPFVNVETLNDFINLGITEDINAMRREFRKWVIAHKPQAGQ